MPQLSQSTQKIVSKYQQWRQSFRPEEKVSAIHVDEVASKVAAFYEKIRGIIDWKEEHLLKRRAIERILKRRLFPYINLGNGNLSSQQLIAEPLVLELIRGGHFPNDMIEESKIQEIQEAIDKYVLILNKGASEKKKSKIQLYSWLSAIAACEIEEILSPSLKERALINYMFEEMKERIKSDVQEKNVQIYIAVQRALFKLDAPIISYHLLKYKYTDWTEQNIHKVKENIEKQLNNPLGDKFYQICEKHDTPFLLLGDILSKGTGEIEEKFANPEILEKEIKEAYGARVKTLKSRLARAAFYTTLSIFLTNVVSLWLIEVPFNKWVTGYFFNFTAMGVDIIFPTLLMFILVITIRPPKKENFPKVLMEVMKFVYGGKRGDVYEIKAFRKKGIVLETIVKIFYSLGFLIIFGLIIFGLYQLNFPPLSYAIFIIFLSLIAFAGAKIRQRGKELQIIEEKESFFRFLIDPFAVPVIQLGKWLTVKWKKYNVIAVFFSALIDMPFTVFIEFLEQWRYYLKEKKEKIH